MLALLAVGPSLWATSHAAFAAWTANPTSGWSTGTVTIADDDSSTAMFSLVGLLPGGSGQKCLVVTYGGTVSATVQLYATGYGTTNAAGAYLNLTIEEGSGSSFPGSGPGACPGFTPSATLYAGTLDGFAATSSSFATGVGSFAPTAAGQARVFRFSYTLDHSVPDAVQAGVTGTGFTWEAR